MTASESCGRGDSLSLACGLLQSQNRTCVRWLLQQLALETNSCRFHYCLFPTFLPSFFLSFMFVSFCLFWGCSFFLSFFRGPEPPGSRGLMFSVYCLCVRASIRPSVRDMHFSKRTLTCSGWPKKKTASGHRKKKLCKIMSQWYLGFS